MSNDYIVCEACLYGEQECDGACLEGENLECDSEDSITGEYERIISLLGNWKVSLIRPGREECLNEQRLHCL